MNAFDAAEKNGRAAELQRELENLFASRNQSTNSGYVRDWDKLVRANTPEPSKG